MKKFIISIIAVFAVFLMAHTPGKVTKNYGASIDVPGVTAQSITAFGGTSTDTIGGADTSVYIINVSKVSNVSPFIELRYKKVSGGATTMTVTFEQSNDNRTATSAYTTVKKGAAQSAYSKTFTAINSDSTAYISFRNDTARFEGVYLKVTIKTTSVGSNLAVASGVIKFNSNPY